MATLVNKICKLCGVKTWEEDGFIQCDCMMVDKNAWEHGVAETPKEWVNMPPMKIFHSPRVRFVNNGDVSIRLAQEDHTYVDLVIVDMRIEEGGYGWFVEQVAMEEESQTDVRYFETLADTIKDAIVYISIRNKWANQIPLIEKFLEINNETV